MNAPAHLSIGSHSTEVSSMPSQFPNSATRKPAWQFLPALLLISVGAGAGTIHMDVEAPSDGQPFTGVGNLRGWAVSSSGIDRVELYIDGAYRTPIPMGGSRNDVAKVYPNYPEAATSGFSMAYSFNNLVNGPHTMTFRVVDKDGDVQSKTVAFETIGFHTPYLQDPSKVDYSSASFSTSGQSIQVQGMMFDGRRYDAVLTWRPESQRFQFSEITSSGM
jgi:hypothetical protein